MARSRLALLVLVVSELALLTAARSSVEYRYDVLGRLKTAKYDNGLCIAYSYDANGNRTSQTNTIADTPEEPEWGTGVWGCFEWTP